MRVIEDQITTLRPYIGRYGLVALVAIVAMSLGVDGVGGQVASLAAVACWSWPRFWAAREGASRAGTHRKGHR